MGGPDDQIRPYFSIYVLCTLNIRIPAHPNLGLVWHTLKRVNPDHASHCLTCIIASPHAQILFFPSPSLSHPKSGLESKEEFNAKGRKGQIRS